MSDNTDALQYPDLPQSPSIGQSFHDPANGKTYTYLKISHGPPGSRWAYWHDRKRHTVVADVLFDRSNLAGRLLDPWMGNQFAWVQTGGEVLAPESRRIYMDNHAEGRYERNTVDDIRFPQVKDEQETPNKET